MKTVNSPSNLRKNCVIVSDSIKAGFNDNLRLQENQTKVEKIWIECYSASPHNHFQESKIPQRAQVE